MKPRVRRKGGWLLLGRSCRFRRRHGLGHRRCDALGVDCGAVAVRTGAGRGHGAAGQESRLDGALRHEDFERGLDEAANGPMGEEVAERTSFANAGGESDQCDGEEKALHEILQRFDRT